MRLIVSSSIIGLTCFILGFAVERVFFHTDRLEVLQESVLLKVRAPQCDDSDTQLGLDAVWQRKINNAVFDLADKDYLRPVLHEPDVTRTGWYQSFSDNAERLDALQTDLHVAQVPETSYIAVTFDAAPPDARIIVNTVARNFESIVTRQVVHSHRAKLRDMGVAVNRLFLQEEDLRLEAKMISKPWVLEERQMELKGLVERRLELQLDLEEEMARFRERDVVPVYVVKYGVDSTGWIEF